MSKDPLLCTRIYDADLRVALGTTDEPDAAITEPRDEDVGVAAAQGSSSASGYQRKRTAEEEAAITIGERERYERGRELFEEVEVRARSLALMVNMLLKKPL